MRRILKLALAIAALGATQASAQVGRVLTEPDWVKKPSAQDMRQVWPTEALRKGLDGSATIACKVSAQGVLFDCEVAEETPPGSGFGAAAVALTPQFQMRPRTRDGKPVAGGMVRIPIRFVARGVRGSVEPGPSVATDIPWIGAPTFDQVLAAYPKRARDNAVGGRVAMVCTYTRAGRLTHCNSDAGIPAGYGFGPAAEKLSDLFVGPPLGEKLAGADVRAQLNVVFAAETLSGSRLIGKPKWTEAPNLDDLKAVYPKAATSAGAGQARVVLKCHVVDGGRMERCAVENEDPAGLGFGEAAVKLSPTFKVSVWSGEGLPTVGGEVRVPIRFDLSGPPPAVPAKP